MTVTNNTLLMLATRAPAEPDALALADWALCFMADYPEPWKPVGGSEALIAAGKSCDLARGFTAIIGRHDAYRSGQMIHWPPRRTCLSERNTPEWNAWSLWRWECRDKFARDEWPLVWARRIAADLEAATTEGKQG